MIYGHTSTQQCQRPGNHKIHLRVYSKGPMTRFYCGQRWSEEIDFGTEVCLRPCFKRRCQLSQHTLNLASDAVLKVRRVSLLIALHVAAHCTCLSATWRQLNRKKIDALNTVNARDKTLHTVEKCHRCCRSLLCCPSIT